MTEFDALLPKKLGEDDRARLTALLAAASAPSQDGPQPGEAAALAAFRELVAEPAGVVTLGSRRAARWRSRGAAASAATAVVLLSSGVAAAATGTLPGAAQDVAKNVFSVVGVRVPASHPAHPAHPGHPATPASPQASVPADGTTTGPSDVPAVGGSASARPSHPAFPTMPPTPGNSGQARQHGVPTPGTHPSPGHGQPTAQPAPRPQSHPQPRASAHRHATPSPSRGSVMQRARSSISH